MSGTARQVKTTVKPSLEDSELRYRRLFETAQDGILILDAKTGRIEDVNPYLIKLLGYSRDEFVKKKLWEVGAFKDVEASKEAFQALQENEYIRYEDLPLKAKDGGLIEVEFVSNVYLVGGKKVIQCDIRDITEHRRIIVALQKNEKRYHDLVNQSPDGMFIIELSGRIVTVNKAMCEELAYPQAELLSMKFWDLIPEPFLGEYREKLMGILNGESLREAAEYVVRGKDGKEHYVEILSAAHYVGKDLIGFYGIARDLTSRRRADEQIRASQRLLDGIINAIPVRVFWKDRQGVYLGCNAEFARDLGFADPDDIIGKQDNQLGRPDRGESYRSDDLDVITSDRPKLNIEEPVTTAAGNVLTVLTSKLPLRSAESDVIGVLGTYVDISERKRAENEVKEQLDELQRWQLATVGRETRVLDLKHEVNQLLGSAGEPPRYPSAEAPEL